MTRAEIFEVMDNALLGLSKVRITLKPSELGDLIYLLRMKQSGMVNWDEFEDSNINELCRQSSEYHFEWQGSNDPIIEISFTYKFDEYFFLKHFADAINTIKIVQKPGVL